ncbi:RNA 2'-phosphotransferase [Mucilaginibacter roseus]|uniref:Probable RNA 2'-phosphotransferase n=1 Tax=Mucilaginibacter roseus TaxID=1528868 RepID=A0ABS8TVZ7_9SPHI|nr:RNA 2'-phosphotransferase [Mucilaginibacter roseus]MCD8739054.1 RNA 2'-phosphotransferase [Mucilaginibacter roseus]
MSNNLSVKISRLMSLALRHSPETLGITLDENGWCEVPKLLTGLENKGHSINIDTLTAIVKSNEKQRFAFDDSGTRIRANQGHSLNVDLGLSEAVPPEYLFHGSTVSNLASIQANGLLKGGRQHVHLSTDFDTVLAVGKRHGKPLIFQVSAGKMATEGYKFFVSANEVWLTDFVPPEFIQVL